MAHDALRAVLIPCQIGKHPPLLRSLIYGRMPILFEGQAKHLNSHHAALDAGIFLIPKRRWRVKPGHDEF